MKKIILFILLIIIAGCAREVNMMKLTSPDFKNNQKIPEKFTCKGNNFNPGLEIENIPVKAKSLVLIMDDPDAPRGTWVHWIVWNIPITEKIYENSVPGGSMQGTNSANQTNYIGPCPPSGTHRYFFKLYALDTTLNLPKTSTKAGLEQAMQPHVIEKAELIGLFSK
ncbi:YbhB/YbcL family Raf kinase inhibitor-like protein [Candidatus Woesearchaeota archaeon]|nr:YbhB/YbcL family Raf kinase inhibitor-like protein [Candidatus Woesearchaeota archaeon]